MEHLTATLPVNALGLTLLHPRTVEPGSQPPPTVNIVFVHGLRGHPRKTWEYPALAHQDVLGTNAVELATVPEKKRRLFGKLKHKILKPSTLPGPSLQTAGSSGPVNSSKTIYWPADLLPSVVPRAKIWTYGYNADVHSGFFQANNKNSILEHGNDFMMKVERALRDQLPIIFVAHSVGGLVVKVAINDMQSSIDDRYRQFSHRIRAIVFCGSPHRGSDATAWGKLARSLFAMALMDANSRLLSDLEVDSRILSLIQANFLKALHREPLRIHSFQEGRALTGVRGLNGKIVDDFSSKLGWAPETFETIDADHREMVKKPGFKDISDILKDFEQDAVKTVQDLNTKAQVEHQALLSVAEGPVQKARRLNILQKLYTSPYEDRKNRNPERVDGTCQWFTNHQLFQAWQTSKTSNLLWVSADPGCGKSVLAKYLVDDVLSQTNSRITCYFFFKDDFPDQRSPESALCCILRQIFIQKPTLLSDMILERFEQDEEKLLDSFGGLWNIFLSVASGYKGEIICILDALDECEESGRSQMTKNICKLHETDSAENSKFVVKFLLTSRPYIHIRREFQILENRWPTIHLSGENEVEVDKISAEIDIVIKSRVGSLSEKLQLQPEEQQVLQDELTRVPNRTYLWVYLMFDVIEDIISVTEDNLRETIRCVPGTLDAAYERILSKTRNREKAMRLLHIVVAAYRPLSLKEMALALAIKEHHRSYIDLKPEPEDRFRQTVRELCGLFVTIIDSKIYLLHQTAREFLVQQDYMNTIIIPNLQWKSSLRLEESDRIVAEICIWYLLFDEFKSSSQLGEETATQYTNNYIFVSYSAENWNHHFKWAVIGNDDPMQHLALRLFDEERRRVWFEIFRVGFSGRPYPTCFDALILASYFGIESIVKLSLEEVANVDLRDTGGRTPLWWTAYRGYDVISALLLKNGADIEAKDNENGWTPLYSAANCGNEAVCKLLLENGADIEAKDNKNGWTPLYSAADCGNEAICKLLLENGADIEAKDNENGWTPLYSAGNYGNEAVCKLLLENGADIEAKDNFGKIALHAAVDCGNEAVCKLLLENGADIEAKDNFGETALHTAVICRNEAAVKLLLENGADIEAKDNLGKTAIHTAVIWRNEAAVKLLLENGADIEAKDHFGETALHAAAIRGNEAVCKLLLERSDLINEKDNNGNTALHLAVDYIEDDSVRMAVITMLLKAGASITRINRYGRTPLGRWETIKHWHRFMSLQIEYWETFRGARCQARGLGVITWRNRLRLKARRRVFRR